MRFKGFLLIVFSLLFLHLDGYCQDYKLSASDPVILPNDLPQAMIPGKAEFKGAEILKYWGDCPEVLYEYGIKRMIFQDVFANGNLYRTEICEMRDSAAAFGAYSIVPREAGEKDSLYEYSFHNNREMLFAKGSWFIRISTLKLDTVFGRKDLVALAKILLSRIQGNAYTPPGILTAGQLRQFRSDLKLIKGYLGLYYGFPGWVSLFAGIKYSEIAILPVTQTNGKLNFARIVFQDGAELEKFQHMNSFYDPENTKYKKNQKQKTEWLFLRTGENTAILMEGTGENPFINALLGQIETIGSRK